jgi:hypothetical protein
MNQEQREKLKQAAMKATPGPWIAGDDEDSDYFLIGPEAYPDIVTRPVVKLHAEYDALYLAAANPAAILSLIAQVEALTVPQGDCENVFQAAITELVMRHIDRMNDVCEEDTAERIVNSFVEGFNPCFETYMDAKFPERAAIKARKTAPTIPAIPGTKEPTP